MKTLSLILATLVLVGCSPSKPDAPVKAALPSVQPPPVTKLKEFLKYKPKAEKGDASAQFNLGRCYFYGQGVAKDEVEAVKWYRKAADQGNARGQSTLGFCYANGTGVAKDEVEAVKWYHKAADQGNAWAQSNLGDCYARGEGVAKDEVEAVKWYRKAADQGNARAQYTLGICYRDGEGVAKDEVEAYALLNISEINYSTAVVAREDLEKQMSPDQRAAGQRRRKELQKEIEAAQAKNAGK